MGGLNVHADDQRQEPASEKKKWYKSPKIIIGLAVLIAVPVVGTTLATPGTTITVNDNTPIVFGQGTQAALACDSNVYIRPHQVYDSSGWYMDKITIDELDITTPTAAGGDGCSGAHILLQVNGSGNATYLEGGTISFSCDSTGAETDIPDNNMGWAPTVTCHIPNSGPHSGDAQYAYVTIQISGNPATSSLIGGFAISQG
jgi:hypothetical protein